MKKIISVLFIILALCTLISCGSGSVSNDESLKNDFSQSEDTNISHATDAETNYEEKIIKTYSLRLQTDNYTVSKNNIIDTARTMGGYVAESSEQYGVNYSDNEYRTLSLTVRVPQEKADEYVESITQNVFVISNNLSTENITDSYYDLESTLESLIAQEARIQKLIEQADSLDYLIQLEDKLASLRAEINYINKQLQYYDNSVNMSYVYITLEEEATVTNNYSFTAKVKQAFIGTFRNFVDFCQGLVIALIWLLPMIIIAAIAVPLFIVIYRRHNAKLKEKFEAAKKIREENEKNKEQNK